MSSDFLALIPQNSAFVPTEEAQSRGKAVLQALAPQASAVEVLVFDHVEFIDQGANFEKVLCPSCRAEVTDQWGEWMSDAAKTKYSDLSLQMVCCGVPSDLHALHYVMPAGFARFCLRAQDPGIGGFLSEQDLTIVENAVGAKLRQILAHY